MDDGRVYSEAEAMRLLEEEDEAALQTEHSSNNNQRPPDPAADPATDPEAVPMELDPAAAGSGSKLTPPAAKGAEIFGGTEKNASISEEKKNQGKKSIQKSSKKRALSVSSSSSSSDSSSDDSSSGSGSGSGSDSDSDSSSGSSTKSSDSEKNKSAEGNSEYDTDGGSLFSTAAHIPLPPLYHTVQKARQDAMAPRVLGGGGKCQAG